MTSHDGDDAHRRRRAASRRRRSAQGEMHEYELNGKLMYPMSVAASPSVAPQILIENASYGWTEELLDGWKARYHKDIFDMLIPASRGAAALSRHLHESSPGEEVVGGLFFDFGAVRTALTEMLRAGKRSERKGLLD